MFLLGKLTLSTGGWLPVRYVSHYTGELSSTADWGADTLGKGCPEKVALKEERSTGPLEAALFRYMSYI